MMKKTQKYYDVHKAEIGNTPFESVKDAIIAQITYEKQTGIVNKYYEDLLNKYKLKKS